MSRPGWSLRDLYAAAWLEGLAARTPPPPGPIPLVRLDTTGRSPVVPLRPPQRPHGA